MESLNTLAAMNMKKQTKSKLNKIWAKIKKPLMILSFVGNILFLLFIVVGCVGSKKQAQQTNAEDTPQVFTLRGTSWELNEYIDTRPDGLKFWGHETEGVGELLSYNASFYSPSFPDNGFLGLEFYRGTYVGWLEGRWYDETFEKHEYFYDVSERDVEWEIDSRIITFYNEIHYGLPSVNYNEDFENTELINWLLNNATLLSDNQSSSFTFLEQINYNGFFGQPIDTMFINANNTGNYTLTIDLPYFVSNGQLFNVIRCYYLNGYSMGYIDDNGSIATNSNNQTWYFLEMEYFNSYTGLNVPVNYRKFKVSTNTNLMKGSTWIAGSYRYLIFQSPLTPEQRKNLESFNNDNFSGFDYTSTNVGIGNVFQLLGQCFVSLKGLFSLEILPNISLGLFIFMPLIVGIIITIIWVVKR